ncbi:hypothetical protein CLV51_105172 [Chitinophaga niastensis]|uniref:Uncharacterized protein n=1 Tax=Chitinophaga niastensis TaxID=536980 RepID=A0A2P8HF03_CHINA|nr:contractile injection system tape measure protein [Chitinophaga niastensis]PSL44800.1 hypothetical protein CLV51_105172 [Chitinophaga niastensis]
MTHMINRLEFEVGCSDEEQALNLRHNFSLTMQDQVMAVMDKICSKYVTDEEWLRIDKLEIDLGGMSQHAFTNDFENILSYRLEEALVKRLAAIPATSRAVSQELSKLELLQFFLLHGILPWWAAMPDININTICLDVLLQQQSVLQTWLMEHRQEQSVWTRITMQLGQDVKALILAMPTALATAHAQFISWIAAVSNQLFETGNMDTVTTASADEFIQQVLSAKGSYIHDILLGNAPAIFSNTSLVNIFRSNAVNIFSIITNKENALLQIIASVTGTALLPADMSVITEMDTRIPDAGSAEIDEIEKIAVKHAGIVLLAPFLKTFFTAITLLDGNEWKDRAAQHKALHVLKYLATGDLETPEYNLALEKLFCGIALNEPVPLKADLSETDMQEAEALLTAVIGHWKLLKNTSVNGLRSSFLKRDGLITRKDGGWLVQVERQTLDVLLDGIPWGYSTITLPWNQYLIFVEW